MVQQELSINDYDGEVHYFASTVFGWATGTTRDEAIQRVVNDSRRDYITITKNLQKDGKPGAYVWSCEVMAPSDAKYSINYYQPKIDWRDGLHHYVTYITQKQMAYCTTKEAI